MDSKLKIILSFIISLVIISIFYGVFSIYSYLTPKSDEFFKNIEKSATFYNDNILKTKLDNALDNFYTLANEDKKKNKTDRENFKITNAYFENLLKSSAEECKENCFVKEYKNLENEKISNINKDKNVSFKIKDVSYTFNIENTACISATSTTSHICGSGYIDINSTAEPNKLGYDLFNASIYADEKGTFFIAPTNISEVARTRCTAGKGYDCIYFALNKDLFYMNNVNGSKSNSKIAEKPYLDIYKLPHENKYVFYNFTGYKGNVTLVTFFENLSKIIKYKILTH